MQPLTVIYLKPGTSTLHINFADSIGGLKRPNNGCLLTWAWRRSLGQSRVHQSFTLFYLTFLSQLLFFWTPAAFRCCIQHCWGRSCHSRDTGPQVQEIFLTSEGWLRSLLRVEKQKVALIAFDRYLLATCSPVFCKQFFGLLAEKNKNITIRGTTG